MARRTLIEKLVILNRARVSGNITQTCKEFGISRVSYYHIKGSVAKSIFNRPRADSNAPDRKAIIGEIALSDPALSSTAISKQLFDLHSIQVSHATVHNVLQELGLSRSEQRWQYLEDYFKNSLRPLELSVRQRMFMQNHNLCYSAYRYDLSRPLEQLHLDVVRVGDHRAAVAVDPVSNYAFALILPRTDRRKIIAWLDAEVFPKIAELGFAPSTVATSNLRVFTDHLEFDELCVEHAVKRIDQFAVKPILDGSVHHFHRLLLQAFAALPAQCADADSVARALASWSDEYNRQYAYPYYPNYELTPAAMLEYYRRHGVIWRGRRSLFARFRGYISPVSGLRARARASMGQAGSVYFSWVSSLFK